MVLPKSKTIIFGFFKLTLIISLFVATSILLL